MEGFSIKLWSFNKLGRLYGLVFDWATRYDAAMAYRDIFLCLLIALFWGFNYIAVKVAVGDFEPMTAMMIRYALVSLCLFPFFIRMPRNLYWPVFKVGMFIGAIYFGLFFWAARELSVSLASIILQLQVPFSLIFSLLFLKEPPSFLGVAGTILAFVGVFCAIGKVEWEGDFFAILLLFLAAASWGYGNILVRRLKLSVDPLTLNAGIACFSLPFFVILVLIMEPHAIKAITHVPLIAWGAQAYMVLIGTIFCYSAWFKLIHRYNVVMIIPSMLLVPIIAIFFSRLFLNEAITLQLVIGAAITLIGVALVVLPKSIAAFRKS